MTYGKDTFFHALLSVYVLWIGLWGVCGNIEYIDPVGLADRILSEFIIS